MRVAVFFIALFLSNPLLAGCGPSHVKEGNEPSLEIIDKKTPQPAIFNTAEYFPLLQNKRIGIVANHTSTFGAVHLVDSLISAGFKVQRVFGPEHGFRGTAPAGEYVETYTDDLTGVEVYSLYGKNRVPSAASLKDIDVLVFDIQDVGARFYTYISTLTYVMQEAARFNIPLVILDRPNPNGHYVDGPVLQSKHSSFVGLHPIPLVHGMTVAEYALMVNGEKWLKQGMQCHLHIVKAQNYSHCDIYILPIAPSPNLPNQKSIYLYPSLCLFESTVLSLGRGTQMPFQVFGHPDLPPSEYPYSFTPQSLPAAPKPPLLGKKCNGLNLTALNDEEIRQAAKLQLKWLIMAYNDFPDKASFFNSFFEKLSGTNDLREQIIKGLPENEIRESWKDDLSAFKTIRKKYLLYPDFE